MSSLERLRQLGARAWKPVLSLVGGVLAVGNGLKAAGVPLGDLPGVPSVTAGKYSLIAAGAFLIIIVRFPRVAFAITHLILGPPPPPPPGGMIFRGPLPYSAGEKLPGRQEDLDRCRLKLEAAPLFILDGESGSGKSSFLNALLLPRAREKFRVIECRVGHDPFGKLHSAILNQPYHADARKVTAADLLSALDAITATHTTEVTGPARREQAAPVLLCIDQFEELFATVKDGVRVRFVDALKPAIATKGVRVILALRSDFIDLLMRLFDAVDPGRETLDLGNYHTLRAFRRDQAEAVTAELLAPIHGDDPLLAQQIEVFGRALVRELLRPPRDKRLCMDDEKTVLPVELQTVGMMLESSGERSFSVAALRRLGGKLGLLRAYIEDAKTYVWRRTAVSGEKAVLILRQLISPAQTKWVQTAHSVAMAVQMSEMEVERVLDAFAEKYLVNSALADPDGSIPAVKQYELMHEHLVQILAEAPDPILQRARDAEERLRFWSERAPAGGLTLEGGRLRRLRNRIRGVLIQPIPLLETLRLWRFARSGERVILRQSFRAFTLRVTIVALVVAMPVIVWFAWSRTERYQIRRVLADAPVAQAASSTSRGAVTEWVKTLTYLGRIDQAFAAAREVTSTQDRSKLLMVVGDSLIHVGKIDGALRAFDEAYSLAAEPIGWRTFAFVPDGETESRTERMARTGKIDEWLLSIRRIPGESVRTAVLVGAARGLRAAGQTEPSNQALAAALAAAREVGSVEKRVSALAGVAKELVAAGKPEDIRTVVDEAFHAAKATGKVTSLDLAELLAGIGKVEESKTVFENALAEIRGGAGGSGLSTLRVMSRVGLQREALQAVGGMKENLQPSALGEIAIGLADRGRIDEAVRIAQKISDSSHRRSWLDPAVYKLVSTGSTESAFRLIDQFAPRDIPVQGYSRSEVLGRLGSSLVTRGNIEAAVIVFANRHDDDRAVLGEGIARALVDADEIRPALTASRAIQEVRTRQTALAVVSLALANGGSASEGISVLDESLGQTSDVKWDRLWRTIFEAQAERSIRSGMQSSVWAAAKRITNPGAKLAAIVTVASVLVENNQTEEAKANLNEVSSGLTAISDPQTRAEIIPEATILMAQLGLTDQAKQKIKVALAEIKAEEDRTSGQLLFEVAIAVGLAYAGNIEASRESFQQANEKISNEFARSQNVVVLATALALAGHVDSALEIIQQLKARSDESFERDQLSALREIAERLAKVGKVAEAIRVAQEIKNSDEQPGALLAVVTECIKAKKVDEARWAAELIKGAISRSEAFAEVGIELARSGAFRLARQLADDECSSAVDRLRVYTAILLEHAKAKDPGVRAWLVSEERKDDDDVDSSVPRRRSNLP